MNALEVKNLNKSYKGFNLDNVSFSLPQGVIMGLIGENGAGKSTTIKLIMNSIRRDSGDITVLGKDNNTDFTRTKEDIGVVLDEAYYPECMTPVQINKCLKYTYRNWSEKQFFDYMEKFGLPLKKSFKEFSRGMKMKLSIAVAMSHDAKLLILDEATSGLDPMAREEILNIFFDYTREENHTILISSHIISDLEKLCDYITFIHKGKVLFSEEKDQLLEDYAILRCGNEDLKRIPKEQILGKRSSAYSTEVLVKRSKELKEFNLDKAGVEDIILLMTKKEVA